MLRVATAAEGTPAVVTRGGEKFSVWATDAGEIATEVTVAGKRLRLVPTAAYPRRKGEKWGMPRLIVGPDGQPWLFYASSVRRFTYYHRWLGDDWGPRHDGRGFYFVDPDHTNALLENYLPIEDLQVRSGPEAVEMVLHSRVWGVPEKRVESIRPARPAVSREEGMLLLDTSLVAETRGLVRVCEAPKKHPANPVFTPGGKAGMPDHMGVMNHGTVLRDRQGRFRMWYSGYERIGGGPTPTGRNWQEYMHVCYSESRDGIHWVRPELGIVPFGGSNKNNLLPLFLTPVVVEDAADPDPSRRFKAVQQVGVEAHIHPFRSHLQVSPDGLQWRTLAGRRIYPGTRPWWFEFNCFFRDEAEPDPAKRWKAYGYFSTSATRRTSGLATSPDCLTWTGYPENPIIDPFQGVKEHVHDLVVWKEQGLYVGLVQVRDADLHYEFELVFSHDGVHFSRVQDGRVFLGLGGPKDWDCELMTLASAPVFVGDEIWFYYGAKQQPEKLDGHGDTWSHVTTSAGLATMKRGRYVGHQPATERPGVLRTMPIPLGDRPLRLWVNAACAANDALRVSVVDAGTGKTIAGFDDCQPVVQDGVATAVTWRKPVFAPSPGRVAIVFELAGKARLYGFQSASA